MPIWCNNCGRYNDYRPSIVSFRFYSAGIPNRNLRWMYCYWPCCLYIRSSHWKSIDCSVAGWIGQAPPPYRKNHLFHYGSLAKYSSFRLIVPECYLIERIRSRKRQRQVRYFYFAPYSWSPECRTYSRPIDRWSDGSSCRLYWWYYVPVGLRLGSK